MASDVAHLTLVGVIFCVVIILGAGYELWAFIWHPYWTITALTARHPHRMLIVCGVFFLALGYTLGLKLGGG